MKVKNLCIGDTYVVTHPCTLQDYWLKKAHYQTKKSNILYLYTEFYNTQLRRCYIDVIDGEIYSYGFPVEADIGQGFIMARSLDFNAVSDMLYQLGYTKPTISKRKLKKLLRKSKKK